MKKRPIYLSIAQDIVDQIKEGKLKAGDQLMTEAQLCEKYNVSRMTVNKALTNLVVRGYINRTAGRGSFVEKRVLKDIDVTNRTSSFTHDMELVNKKAGSKLISYKIIPASEIGDVKYKLQLNDDDLVHVISRLRTGDNIPIALSYTYIPYKFLPAFDINILNHSLYQFLDKTHNIHPIPVDYTFCATQPTTKQKELLELKVDTCALLKSCHVSKIESGDLFEYTETFYVGNQFTYHLSLH